MWGAVQEFKLFDGTRVDCLRKNYAVELDFAPKWAEAAGQSLYYGMAAKKKPAIILILKSEKDFKYYNRAKSIAPAHGISLWYVKSPGYNEGKCK